MKIYSPSSILCCVPSYISGSFVKGECAKKEERRGKESGRRGRKGLILCKTSEAKSLV
jgi:hypothetical protein